MVRTVLAALGVVAITLTIAACGSSSKASGTTGSGSGGSTQTSTGAGSAEAKEPAGNLTREELIAQANAICARANARFSSAKVTSTQELVQKLKDESAYNETQATELEKLVPPASMTRDWSTIVAGVRTIGANTVRVGEYADTQDANAGGRLLIATRTLRSKLSNIAKRNGITECPPL